MSAELARLSPLPAPATRQLSADLLALAALMAVLLAAQHASYAAMIGIWQRSPTFAHGFLIVPISLWLLWRQRDALALAPRQPSALALPLLAGLGAIWLLAAVANVSTVLQYCAILMIPAAAAAALGWQLVRAAAFPLAYLLLAVPFGEIFIAPLIDFTARFTVAALQLSGIPVFRDHSHFILPSGSWDVVDACSGLRYVMASLALGTLFAYLNYRSSLRRLLFILISLVLPVFANGMRAYLIVLIGHLSNMRLAAGIDHLIYGWLFFGLVSLMLFWFGAAWRDQPAGAAPRSPSSAAPLPVSRSRLASIALASAALILAWPLVANWLLSVSPEPASAGALNLIGPPLPWRSVAHSPLDWQALHAGHPQRYSGTFSNGSRAVTLQLTRYPHQYGGAELLTPVDAVIQAGLPQWHEIASTERFVAVGKRRLPMRVTIMQAGTEKLLVWRSYRVDGGETASLQRIKWRLAAAKLLRRADGGAEISLASRFDEQPDDAADAMRQLLGAMLPAIDQELDHAADR